MPKAEVAGSAARRRARRRTAELPNTIEGQVAEICRDLAVQAKRMRQLHEQADELRRVIRQWAGQSEADLKREPVDPVLIVKDDAEK
jgi:polyhydroxyalkanoate synthesis regulator phasin